MFAPTQASFAAALLDVGKPVPEGVTSHTADRPARRFAVYRNNVVAGLVKALGNRFPAVSRIVGEEFFNAMARLFVAAHPPRSPLLMTYGDDFSDFIAGFEPAAELPYLADVARLEAARTRAYHAANAEPVDPNLLRNIAAEALGGMRFVLHPSVEAVRSHHPIVTIWAMNAGEAKLGPIEDWRPEDALIARPRLEVEVRSLPAGGAAFLAVLLTGGTLAEAVEAAAAEDADFDLAANLAGLIGAGLVIGFSTAEPQKD
ncbi:MAG TPA: DNA-binding domain-containing protein [Xanthobacteraceae bacterium]|nr:DNA-binding domain-containing protein [Xanthobacteraceae bacterium]